ncbi:MAG: DUF4112 domain-containing protein [Polyangiaceae bacterium]|nr:DUF4112 domain-containing protein [Polyangiaceae bacterium]NUQ75175.1 DUF4112 domain-containing protein [Polyangiaceae bacterium]
MDNPRTPSPENELAPLAPQDPRDVMVRRAVTLARWLDERWLDPIIGLVLPEAGDLLTATVGLYIVAAGIRKGLPAVVIARMLLNLGVDLAIGAVPALGDLIDFAFKANRRNAKMLEECKPGESTPKDWLVVTGAGLLFLLVLAIPIVGLIWIFQAIFGN